MNCLNLHHPLAAFWFRVAGFWPPPGGLLAGRAFVRHSCILYTNTTHCTSHAQQSSNRWKEDVRSLFYISHLHLHLGISDISKIYPKSTKLYDTNYSQTLTILYIRLSITGLLQQCICYYGVYGASLTIFVQSPWSRLCCIRLFKFVIITLHYITLHNR